MSNPGGDPRAGRAEPQPDPREILAARFPGLRPIKRPPGLQTINTIGVRVYGRRDVDEATGTYVKTRAVCALFIPLVWIDAYRVADATGGGWYFLGKDRLSPLQRAWNAILLLGLATTIAVGAWTAHTRTAEYVAREVREEAQALLDAGDLVGASTRYASLAKGVEHAAGLQALRRIVAESLPSRPLEEVARIVRIVAGGGYRDVLDAEATERLAAMAAERRREGPRAALDVLDALEKRRIELATKAARDRMEGGTPKADDGPRVLVLEALAESEPEDAEVAVLLALAYEGRDELERSAELLSPHRERLGDSEGARILGRILAARGEADAAHALLTPYVEARLERLSKAEARWSQAMEDAWGSAIAQLNSGAAGDAWYARYERLSPEKKQEAVQQYAQQVVSKSPSVQAAREALEQVAGVVPVALDLGIVRLHRAQAMADPDARRAELEAAERVFTAIQGLAGDDVTFKLQSARVAYWLGQEEDGQRLLAEVLDALERTPRALLEVASVKREIGLPQEARVLAEEAYETARTRGEDDLVRGAARFRSLLATDLDDEIDWLEKGGGESAPEAQAGLLAARGRKALNEGNEESAIRYLRRSIEAYGRQPETASTLNNAAYAYATLYRIDGSPQTFLRYVDMVVRAHRLQPDDSVLLSNVAWALASRAVLALHGEALDFGASRLDPQPWYVDFLVTDDASRRERYAALAGHEDMRAALERLRELRVVAPKSLPAYGVSWYLLGYAGEAAAHDRLGQAFEAARIDTRPPVAETVLELSTPIDDATREEVLRDLARRREVTERVRGRGRPAALALALAEEVEAELARQRIGLAPDDGGAAIVEAMEAAHRAAPSDGSRSALIKARAMRAIERLRPGSEALRTLHDRLRRAAGPHLILAVALSDPSPREAIARDPDVLRIADLCREAHQVLPSSPALYRWALLRALDPSAAEAMGRSILANDLERTRVRLAGRFFPMRPGYVLEQAWLHELEGDAEAAKRVLNEASRLGLPVR